jgi:hypothetical protein
MWNLKGAVCLAAAGLLAAAGTASAAETASATISSAPSGSSFKYTIALTNTSTDGSKIGTFWFSWILSPIETDFMEVAPTSLTAPTGWASLVSHNTATDGFGFENLDAAGATDLLAPGNTDTFTFISTEPLSQILGNSTIGSKLPETTAVIYAGLPESDAGFQFNVVAVPEPVSVSMLALCGGGLWMRRRRA